MLKTNPKMYDMILKKLKVDKADTLVVGDSIETDIKGAESAGINAVLVDRRGRREFSPKIQNLEELDNFLKK